MNKLFTIARREYVERVRTRWFIISTLFGPILFAGVTLLPIIMSNRDISAVNPRIEILDATGTRLGRYVARALSATRTGDGDGSADVQPVTAANLPVARTSATHDVMRRLASGYIVLDSATLRGDSVQYSGRRSDSRGEQTRIGDAVRSGLLALKLEDHGVTPTVVDSVVAIPAPVLSAEDINDAGLSAATPAKMLLAGFVALFLYMSILLYGQSMLSGVIEEKLTRVAEIVVSSVSPDVLLAGKVLGVTAVGLTQQIVWVLGSIALIAGRSFIFGTPAVARHAAATSTGMQSADFLTAVLATPWSWVGLVVVFFLLGFVFYGSLYAAVGATVGSEQEARQAAMPVVLLLIVTVVFISPILTNPTSQLAHVMSLLPFSAPIIMPLRMAITDVPPLEIAGSIGILIASCFAAVWLAARIYRVGLLMYGKRPNLRELRRWVFAS